MPRLNRAAAPPSPDPLATVAVSAWGVSAFVAPWAGWQPIGFPHHATSYLTAALVGLALRWAWARWRGTPGPTAAHVRATVSGAFALAAVMAVFVGWKVRLPALVPFFADPALAATDTLPRAGATWLLASPIGAAVAQAGSVVYYLGWGTLTLVVIGGVLSAPPSALRARALVSFAGILFGLGVVGAFLGSSAGPLFVGRIAPGAPNGAYLAALERATGGGYVLTVRDVLLASYEAARDAGWRGTVVSGISAFPSIHVALGAWMALVARAYRWRGLDTLTTVMATAVLGLSVVLGMHYTADGAIALFGVAALWRLAGRWAAA